MLRVQAGGDILDMKPMEDEQPLTPRCKKCAKRTTCEPTDQGRGVSHAFPVASRRFGLARDSLRTRRLFDCRSADGQVCPSRGTEAPRLWF
jgi:hypothetical protein